MFINSKSKITNRRKSGTFKSIILSLALRPNFNSSSAFFPLIFIWPELSLFPTNPDKTTFKFFWFLDFSVIKSSVFNMMWARVLSLVSINLLSASDFFWINKSIFSLAEFWSEFYSYSSSKFFNAIESNWRNPLIGFLSLVFESFHIMIK